MLTKISYPRVTCICCGNCCRIPVVPVTHKDLSRLLKSTGLPAKKVVRFCPFSEMEYDADAGLWIKFGSSKRAMVLRRRHDKCIFQTADCACSAYPARPQTCRTFPYSVYFKDEKNITVEEIKLNKILDCSVVKRANVDIDAIIENVRKENREDREYCRLVKRWNDSNNKGTTVDFLQFIGF